MEGLDLLKQSWNNENRFRKIPKDELYEMAHKKSASVMKWIVLVSVIEFLIWFVLPLFFSEDITSKEARLITNLGLNTFLNIISYVHYAIMVGFVLLFFRNYKKIQLNDNAKQLMASIVRVRKTIMYYVNITIFLILLRGVVSICVYFSRDKQMADLFVRLDKADKLYIMVIIIIVLLLLVFGAITALIWLYYKVVYGLLMKKLYRNYEDLKKVNL